MTFQAVVVGNCGKKTKTALLAHFELKKGFLNLKINMSHSF